MHQPCKKCQKQFEVTQEDLAFYDKVSPVFNGKKYNVPPPTLCPTCRQQRRLAIRNEYKLYQRQCDHYKKPIISIHSPDKKTIVYDKDYFLSDAVDALAYGRDFDFSRPFFEQFYELYYEIPHCSLQVYLNENSDYANYSAWNKDCYLIFECDNNQFCMFGKNIFQCRDCVDSSHLQKCEVGYQLLDCNNCYNCKYLQNCENCSDAWFLKDCIGCKNCFGCINLKNQEYCFFNEQLSKEAYEKKIESLQLHSYKELQKIQEYFSEHVKKFPHRYFIGTNNENCTGNYLYNSNNSHFCFDVSKGQNSKYVFNCENVREVYDCDNYGGKEGMELVLEGHCHGSGVHNILFSHLVYENCFNIYYSWCCMTVKNCFGCINLLDKKEYCILNKQYTKDEYEALVPKIIEHMKQTGEWGEFFDPALAPFGYNESKAMDYFPLTKEEAIAQGFTWSDYVPPDPKVDRTIQAAQLPDTIEQVNEEVCNWAIVCEVTKRPFRITKPELGFYKKHNLPLPRRHPEQRFLDRMDMRNPRILWDRHCDNCDATFQTTYVPERSEKIYCETCYQKEVY